MRALIFGATGLVGQALWSGWKARPNWEIFGTRHKRPFPGMEPLNIGDAAAVKALLSRVKPELVVLAAANPYVDYCESHPGETGKINVESTIKTAEAAAACGAGVVFLSSDYVFDGTRAPYKETDAVCPINEYGRQKVEAERGIARAASRHLILRISGVFGWEEARKNFVLQVLDRIASKTPIQAAVDIRYHPTYAPNLAPVLAGLAQSRADGIFHAAGADEMSRHEFALEIARVFELDSRCIEPAHLADLKVAAPRPPRSSLVSARLTPELFAHLWGARRALQHMRQTQKRSPIERDE